MSKDILFQMVANKRGGIDPSKAIQSAIIETAHLEPNTDCRVELNPETGTYKVFRYWEIVADETEKVDINQIVLSAAQQKKPASKVGESISEEIHFSRIDFQKFKRLFSAEMRKAERSQITDAYRARIGEILIGTVRRQQFNREGTVLELEENIELLLPHDQMIPREEVRLNDRLYVYLYDIDPNAKGPQLLVSRIAPGLLEGLFKLKILEVASGIIEVKSVARDAGSRAKVAVKTNDGRLNPIGTCIGRSGERVQAISTELNNEHIDIILWDDNPARLVINALSPAEVISITMDKDTQIMDITVRDEDLSRAIGRNGQNVRLASQLAGWTLNIIGSKEAERKTVEASDQSEKFFIEHLAIESEHAKALVHNGFSTLEDLAYASTEELLNLNFMDEDQAERLRNRANDVLLAKAFANEFAVDSDTTNDQHSENETLENLPEMTSELLMLLQANQIDSRDALAELSIDDLLEIAPLTREKAGQLIMNARAHWFKKS